MLQSSDIIQRKTLKALSDAPHSGSYCAPSVLHDLPISKADLCVAISLFKLEQGFRKAASTKDRAFYATVRLIAENAKCSVAAVRRSLARLEYVGLIKCRIGTWLSRRATNITILIDDFYLADE